MPHIDPICKIPPKPVVSLHLPVKPTALLSSEYEQLHIDILELDINVNYEENSLHQEGIIPETYQRPDKSFSRTLLNLNSQINTYISVQKYLP